MARKSGKSITCPNCGCRMTMPSGNGGSKKKDIHIPSNFLLPGVMLAIVVYFIVMEMYKAGLQP